MKVNDALMVVPYRNRGDETRERNLRLVFQHYAEFAPLVVMHDGRTGTEPFNRSKAYNRGVECARQGGWDTIIFCEADMIVPYDQMIAGIQRARVKPGLVVPFSMRCELANETTDLYASTQQDPFRMPFEKVYENNFSMGAVNIVSLQTMNLVGQWDETFEGAWYDDNAMFHAFNVATRQKPRFISGPAVHLWHPPSVGEGRSEEDAAATERNRLRWETQYQRAKNAEQIRTLTAGGTIA